MVTKLRKISEKMCEGWKGKSIIVLWIFVAACLGVGGFHIVATNMGRAGDLIETEYVESGLHEYDVLEDFYEVHGYLTKYMTYEIPEQREWRFQGIYELIIERGDLFYRRKTNIPETEISTDKDEKKELTLSYIRGTTDCYYAWDGESLILGPGANETVGEVLEGEFSYLGSGEKIVLAYTNEMIEKGQVILERTQKRVWFGIFLLILSVVSLALGCSIWILGNATVTSKRSYVDILILVSMLAILWIYHLAFDVFYLGEFRYIESNAEIVLYIFSEVLTEGFLEVILFFSVYQMIINLKQKLSIWEHFISLKVGKCIKEKITGEAYWEEGIVVCSKKRQRVAICFLVAILFTMLFVIYLFAGTGWYGIEFWSIQSIVWQAFCLSLIVLVLICYCHGSRKIAREYQSLLIQLGALEAGNYQNNEMLSETSVFANESWRLAMLGCQIQENLERQMQAERMKVELVTNVSHDLKTPLTSIISYIDLLSKEELSPVARDYVKILENKSDRLKKMIADVFDLTKASSGNLKIHKEKLDLKKLLVQVLADMEKEINSSSIKVVEQLTANPVTVKSDGQKLYRVLQNIFDNALKYSLAGTRVYVTLEAKQGKAVLRVKNVAAYEMNFSKEEVLRRFFRGDTARTTEGSGLGLAIAREFTEVCGGKLDLDIDGDVFIVEMQFDMV